MNDQQTEGEERMKKGRWNNSKRAREMDGWMDGWLAFLTGPCFDNFDVGILIAG